jgi:hypothetical protein
MRVVVDGANVVGSRPDGWWRDRGAAAGRLLDALRRIAAQEPDLELVLVLEGAARAGVPADESSEQRISVVHASGSGDDEIVRRAVDADLVVTADRELHRRVAPVECVGPSWVWDRSTSDG